MRIGNPEDRMRKPQIACIALAYLFVGVSDEVHARDAGASFMTGGVDAARIALARVCLPGILERKSIANLARDQRMVPMPATSVGAGASDKVWRLGFSEPVYAVAWADGSCTVIVDRGDAAVLRAAAEAEIRARREGFQLGETGEADGGRVSRTIHCARLDQGWAVTSITLPGPQATARTRAFSSTTYIRPTPSPLCKAR